MWTDGPLKDRMVDQLLGYAGSLLAAVLGLVMVFVLGMLIAASGLGRP